LSILDQIVATKRDEVAELKRCRPDLLNSSPQRNRRRRFIRAFETGFGTIAEVKKASPSRGIIRSDFDPVELAVQFEEAGAAALSVLTDGPYFQGSPEFIPLIRNRVSLPILRKEFIIDPIQIAESAELGADAILLIQAILSPSDCQNLLDIAHHFGLDVLLEVHTDAELDSALSLSNLDMIGINNRDLQTFDVDISLARRLRQKIGKIHPELPVVAESGYQHIDDLKTLATEAFSAVLIGEGLATNPHLMAQLRLV